MTINTIILLWFPYLKFAKKLDLKRPHHKKKAFCNNVVSICVLSCVQLFVTLWTITMNYNCQAPLSMEISQQEYWSGLPFPPLGYLPNSGIKSMSPILAGRFFTTESPEKPHMWWQILTLWWSSYNIYK